MFSFNMNGNITLKYCLVKKKSLSTHGSSHNVTVYK